MIELRAIRRRLGEVDVLRGVDARFERGEVSALLGPSGGGKSTLLRCINGLEPFDSGELSVLGHTLRGGAGAKNRDAIKAIRARVGMVSQQWNLFAHRTALGNVMEAPVYVRRIAPAVARRRAQELLERVGLSKRGDAYPHELSGGEQQRVAIARALAMEPEALLLDEPTSALDPERAGEVLSHLREIARGGMTIVIVTHEVSFAREVSGRVLVLHGGEVIEEGAPAAVLDAPRDPRTRAFLGLDQA